MKKLRITFVILFAASGTACAVFAFVSPDEEHLDPPEPCRGVSVADGKDLADEPA